MNLRLALSTIIIPATIAISAATDTLTIATYNIRNCIGMDMTQDIDRTAKAIRTFEADVIAVQEVDSCTHRSKGIDILGQLASRTYMTATYSSAIDFDGGRYGLGILSKEQPIAVKSIQLPGREEARTAVIAEFDDYVFCCTHLSLTDEDRILSTEILRPILSGYDKPVFFAGDLNSHPSDLAIKMLCDNGMRIISPVAPTYPADTPEEQIDYIMTTAGDNYVKVVRSYIPDEPIASDHRPIITEIIITINK